jgi:predicted permease
MVDHVGQMLAEALEQFVARQTALRHQAADLIGAQGVNRQVLLLYGCLPAAVVNFILTEKYRQDPDLAASIVVLSTFISVFAIPTMFWLIL